jgi:hypothetical protein
MYGREVEKAETPNDCGPTYLIASVQRGFFAAWQVAKKRHPIVTPDSVECHRPVSLRLSLGVAFISMCWLR